jgi:hypothetical protein
MAAANHAYIPGVCNINHAEIRKRRSAGYLGLSVFVVVLFVCLFFINIRWARIVLVAPAFLCAIGFLQAHGKFCVGYAAAGLQNASEDSQTATAVAKAQVAIDKARARRMNSQALLIAAVTTVISLALPRL